ncbi:Mpo1-like protein [Peijinzhouia sedimentorum]
MATDKDYKSFKEFYPYYLSEHQDATCRVLHFIGTFFVFVVFFWTIATQWWWGFAVIPFIGYGFAWVGHFFFEKNKPATFQYPGYSLASDFKLFFDIILGKEKLIPKKENAQ